VFVVVAAGVTILKNAGDININIAYKPDDSEVVNKDNENSGPIIETDNKVEIYDEPEIEKAEKEFNLVALGEIMMGGEINKNVDYNYMLAFKHISEITSKGDYTVAHLGTNVTDLEEIKNPKSKYIVTSKIDNAFSVLGLDGISLATDHMLDFDKTIFEDTKNLLKNDYDLIGLKNSIIYAENNGVKIAIIGVTNEIIGSSSSYTNAGIMIYNMSKLKSMIKEAKKNAQSVVMMTHLGYENTHQITNVMKWFYRELIKAGADLVLGSHAIGVFPIEIYKDKPIIYSLGYLMHDTDYEVGKKSGIFNFKFNENGKLAEIKITPTYINAKKQVLLYADYNKNEANEFLKYIAKDLKKYTIENVVLTINLD